MQNKVLLFVISVLLISCGGPVSGPTYNLQGFDVENIGNGAKLAIYKGADNTMIAKGTTIGEVRTGAWVLYYMGTNKIKSISNYVNGKKNGIEVLLNDRGQVETLIEYKNNELHGMSAKYKFGRPTEEMNYKDGKLDGPYAIYDSQGKIQRKGSFKNGKQHGTMQYFDNEGNITLQYEYKDGEKISGGIVKQEEDSNNTK